MSWLDLTDLDQNEELNEDSEKNQKSPSKASKTTIKESPSEAAFKKEISELFNNSNNQIPTSQKSIDFVLDLPTLDLTMSETRAQGPFSFWIT